MRYYKNKTQKIHNQSPDVSLIMYNKDGNIIDLTGLNFMVI